MIKRIQLEYIAVFLFLYSIYLKYGGGIFHFLPSTLCLATSSIVSLILLNKNNLKQYDKNHLLIILMFLSVLTAGVLTSNAPGYGSQKTIWLTLQTILYLPIVPVLVKNGKSFRVQTVFFLTLYIVALFIEYGSFQDLLASTNSKFRLGGTKLDNDNFHPIGISRYICFSLIPISYSLFSKIHPISIVYNIILMVLSLGFLFFSATRGPIIAFLIAMAIRFFFSKNGRRSAIMIFSFLSILILYSLNSLIQNKNAQSLYTSRFEEIDDEGRFDFHKQALYEFTDRPIFGHGTGNYGYFYSGEDLKMYPHNIFVEILYENGFLGFLLLILIMLKPAKKLKLLKENHNSVLFLSLFIYALFNSQLSGDIEGNSMIFCFIICFIFSLKPPIIINNSISTD